MTHRTTARIAAATAALVALVAAFGNMWWLALVAAAFAAVSALLPVDEPSVYRDQPLADLPRSRPRQSEAPVRMPAGSDPHVVVEGFQREAESAAGAVATSLWLEDSSSATLRLVAAAGPMAPSPEPLPVVGSTLGAALEKGQSVLEPEVSLGDQEATSTLWRFAVPLTFDDTRGVVSVDIRSREQPDVRPLMRIAASLRASMSGALLLHVARLETRTAQALLESAEDLSRQLSVDEVVKRTLDRAVQISNAATGSVMLVDEESGRLRIAAATGLPRAVVAETDIGQGEGIAGWVLATGDPMLVEDLPGRSKSRRHGIRSAVSVPIRDDSGILGVLNVGSRTYPARFTDAHQKALEILGRQTAIALRNARAMTSTRDLYFSTLTALAVALETKDPYARGATGRVVDITTALGAEMRLDEHDFQALHIAALLHDIGMNMAGGPIGGSPRPLTTIERGMLKTHPIVAAELLAELPAMEAVAPIVYHHHEWFDGHGYVVGLAGEAIPLGSRILAVADAFVAMTSSRSYRRALGVAEALEELADKGGTQFDPEVVSALRDLLRKQPDLAMTTGPG